MKWHQSNPLLHKFVKPFVINFVVVLAFSILTLNRHWSKIFAFLYLQMVLHVTAARIWKSYLLICSPKMKRITNSILKSTKRPHDFNPHLVPKHANLATLHFWYKWTSVSHSKPQNQQLEFTNLDLKCNLPFKGKAPTSILHN